MCRRILAVNTSPKVARGAQVSLESQQFATRTPGLQESPEQKGCPSSSAGGQPSSPQNLGLPTRKTGGGRQECVVQVPLSWITRCPRSWGSLEPFPTHQEYLEAPSLVQVGISPVGSHKDAMSFEDMMGVMPPFLPFHNIPHCGSIVILG